jgi:hypothetical protein
MTGIAPDGTAICAGVFDLGISSDHRQKTNEELTLWDVLRCCRGEEGMICEN